MKNFLNLGKVLNRGDQKSIIGGGFVGMYCNSAEECGEAPYMQLFYQPAVCANNRCSYGG
jgi:hypothetical protein